MLGELRTTLADKDIRLTWDDSLLDWLTEKSFSIKFGARKPAPPDRKGDRKPRSRPRSVTGERPLTGAYLRAADGKLVLDTI